MDFYQGDSDSDDEGAKMPPAVPSSDEEDDDDRSADGEEGGGGAEGGEAVAGGGAKKANDDSSEDGDSDAREDASEAESDDNDVSEAAHVIKSCVAAKKEGQAIRQTALHTFLDKHSDSSDDEGPVLAPANAPAPDPAPEPEAASASTPTRTVSLDNVFLLASRKVNKQMQFVRLGDSPCQLASFDSATPSNGVAPKDYARDADNQLVPVGVPADVLFAQTGKAQLEWLSAVFKNEVENVHERTAKERLQLQLVASLIGVVVDQEEKPGEGPARALLLRCRLTPPQGAESDPANTRAWAFFRDAQKKLPADSLVAFVFPRELATRIFRDKTLGLAYLHMQADETFQKLFSSKKKGEKSSYSTNADTIAEGIETIDLVDAVKRRPSKKKDKVAGSSGSSGAAPEAPVAPVPPPEAPPAPPPEAPPEVQAAPAKPKKRKKKDKEAPASQQSAAASTSEETAAADEPPPAPAVAQPPASPPAPVAVAPPVAPPAEPAASHKRKEPAMALVLYNGPSEPPSTPDVEDEDVNDLQICANKETLRELKRMGVVFSFDPVSRRMLQIIAKSDETDIRFTECRATGGIVASYYGNKRRKEA
jgi:hypothetical protein